MNKKGESMTSEPKSYF